jgi:butyrate kinase
MAPSVLVINPGSTSTKFAVFEEGKELFVENLAITAEQAALYPTVMDQFPFRERQIRDSLDKKAFKVSRLGAIVGRGGLLRPLEGGVYRVGSAMIADLSSARYGEHACNLGGLIAARLAEELGIPAYIADPVVVDELSDVARVSGNALFARRSIFHALNQKAVARRWCRERGRSYSEAVLVVAHMGGGCTVGLHSKGRVVDVNNGLDGEGPFAGERSGTLPAGDLVRACFSGKYAQREMLGMVTGRGGFVSLAGTNDLRVVRERILAGDERVDLAFRAFAYGVGKAIGALAAAAAGTVEGIILTGGMAHSAEATELIRKMCSFIAPVTVYPGEGELEALALAGLQALSGEAPILEY